MMLASILTVFILIALTLSVIAVEIRYSDRFSTYNRWNETESVIHNGPFSELANKTTIRIDNGSLSDANFGLLQNFRTKSLIIFGGRMREITLAPSVKYLHAIHSATVDLLIQPRAISYQIEELRIYNSMLTMLPKNLHRLLSLKVLNLSFNSIESIDMTQLESLEHLRELSLFGNGLKTIQTTSVISLPVLRLVDLHYNKLAQLDVYLWYIPALETLDLVEKNKLVYVKNLDSQFPKLRSFEISKNPLDCIWKDTMLQNMRLANVIIGDLDEVSCDTKSKSRISETTCSALSRSVNRQLEIFQNAKNNFEAQLKEQNEIIANQTKVLQAIEKRIDYHQIKSFK
ncbi:leucine-rich repeat-containing protein 40-like [Wyeomyia smithii]|uniref:leucine-rich repeat-containing protein 40-like n=1 Tax=Wyeomyia smithii TaxID=174621 RepID=UPI002467D6DE|nr:leucine-rich repeat-containing protein 40-like [Wyeomyia smithii]